MATFADTLAPAGFSVRFAEGFKSLATRFAKRRQYSVTVRELSALTTRELTDLGIARVDIQEIAFQRAFGPKA